MAEKKEVIPEPEQPGEQPQIQEVEVNDVLLNNKMNYMIGFLEEFRTEFTEFKKSMV